MERKRGKKRKKKRKIREIVDGVNEGRIIEVFVMVW